MFQISSSRSSSAMWRSKRTPATRQASASTPIRPSCGDGSMKATELASTVDVKHDEQQALA